MSDTESWQRAWERVVAQAWSEDSYKQRVLAEPAAVLREHGLTPADKQLRIVDDTPDTIHLVLPAKPSELSDEDLDHAVGAGSRYCRISRDSDPSHHADCR